MKERRIETPVSHDDLPEWTHFQVSLTQHPIIRDEHGVLRYQLNRLVDWLATHININEMWLLYQRGAWDRETFMQFYRDIGYSLAGFEDVWGEALDEMEQEKESE